MFIRILLNQKIILKIFGLLILIGLIGLMIFVSY